MKINTLRRKLFSHKGVLIILLAMVLLFFEYAGVFITPALKRNISESLNAELKIKDVDLDMWFSVKLKGVSITSGDNEVFSARKIELKLAPKSLLRFKPQINSVVVKDFQVDASYDPTKKKWAFSSLEFAESSSQQNNLPMIHLQNGTLKISTDEETDQDDYLIAFDGKIKPKDSKNNVFEFNLTVPKDSDFGFSHVEGQWHLGKTGHVQLDSGEIIMGSKTILGNCWNLNNTKFDLTYDDKEIRIEQFSCMLGEKTSFKASGSITDHKTNPKYNFRFNLEDANVSNKAKVNSLVYCEETYSLMHFGLVDFLETYQPAGDCDIEINCSGLAKDIKTNSWNGKVTGKNGSIKHQSFPYLVENIKGVIKLSKGSVTLKDLKCKHIHEGNEVDIMIAGFHKTISGRPEYDIQINSPNLVFDKSLYKAIDDNAKKLWWTFSPRGKASVVKKFVRSSNDDEGTNTLIIDLLNTQANYEFFPYQLENITGKVIVNSDCVEFENIVSNYDDSDRKITLSGHLKGTGTEKTPEHILVKAVNIPIDQRLMNALPKSQQRFFKLFEVNALTDVNIKISPNQAGKRTAEYIADVSIKDAAITYNRFPVPLTNVNLKATLTADEFILEEMTAVNKDATVQISGYAWPPANPEENAGLCLKIKAENLQLQQEWIDQIEDQWLGIISQFQPSGPVNIDANINQGAKGLKCGETRIIFDCLGNSIKHKKFPYPIEGINGQIVITEDNIELKDLVANTNGPDSGGRLKLDGTLSALNGTVGNGSLRLTASDFRINESFVNAFPEKQRQLIAPLAPVGSIDLDINKISFITSPGGENILDITGAIEPNNITLGQTFKAEDISGLVNFNTQYEFGKGLESMSIEFDIDSFRIRQQQLNDLKGTVDFDRNTKTFSSKEFMASNGPGVSIGNAEVTFADPNAAKYNLEVMFDGLDLNSIVGNETNENNNGVINGQINITGKTGVNKERTGRLNFDIANMKLAKRSFMAKVLTAMQLGNPTDHMFSDMKVESFLDNDVLRFSKINVSGKSGVFQGKGTLQLDSGAIDLNLSAYGKVLTSNPSLLESLARGFGSAVVKVEVSGSIDQPEVKVTPLPIIQGSIEILGGIAED